MSERCGMCQGTGLALFIKDSQTNEIRGPYLCSMYAQKAIEAWTVELQLTPKAAAWRLNECAGECPCNAPRQSRNSHFAEKLRQILPVPNIAQFEGMDWETYEAVLDNDKRQAFEIGLSFKQTGAFQGRNSAIFYGPVGVGKSGLMYLLYQHFGGRGVWVDYNDFIDLIQSTYDKRTAPTDTRQLLEAMSLTPYLFLDDMGDQETSRPISDDKRNKTYGIIRVRHEKKLPTFITTNLDRGQFNVQFGDRIADRVSQLCGWVQVAGRNLRRNRPPLGLVK